MKRIHLPLFLLLFLSLRTIHGANLRRSKIPYSSRWKNVKPPPPSIQDKMLLGLAAPIQDNNNHMSEDLIRSGAMNEMEKHGMVADDINDMLMGNEGGADPTETERSAASVPTPVSTESDLLTTSSWLSNACKFVKDRAIVNLPAICLQKFPEFVKITSKQRRRCHKLMYSCVAAASVHTNHHAKDIESCTKKHQTCMSKEMNEREMMAIFY